MSEIYMLYISEIFIQIKIMWGPTQPNIRRAILKTFVNTQKNGIIHIPAIFNIYEYYSNKHFLT